MDTQAWQRLAVELTKRRATLRPEWEERTIFARDNGISYRSLSDLETGRRSNYRTSWLTQVEQAYRLNSGAIQRFLEGGELDPADAGVETEPGAAWDGEIIGAAPLMSDEELRWRDGRGRLFQYRVAGFEHEATMELGTPPEEAIEALRGQMAKRVHQVTGRLMGRPQQAQYEV